MSAESITLNRTEFEEIKAQLLHLDAELNRLLAQPLVYATVVRADNMPLGKDGGTNVVIVFDSKFLKSTDRPA